MVKDFTCYAPTKGDGSSYTIGHFGIGDDYEGDKPNVYQVSMNAVNANYVFKKPTGFRNVWSDHGSGGKIHWGIWEVECPTGYGALSDVCVHGYNSPSVDVIWCLREDYLEVETRDRWIWDDKHSGANDDCDINGGRTFQTKELVTATNERGAAKTLKKIKDVYFGK